jgi:Tol biopolymer transport system component/tRNA A-37 threonylcarbamoyl transferase component Bud32
MAQDSLDRLGTALADRYRLERELGQGGMATVYLAADLKHDRQVAIKVLRPELAAVLGAERFVVEIKTTAALQHPHILPLFDSGSADSFLYYVMPYVEGETLRTKLDREKQLGLEEAVRITTEVADALDYAHRHGVIHRDIKPENILLHDGRPMVADFGIALAVSAAAGGRMTETGLSLGTPHYMSPEQATAEKHITHRSDIYSLGAVLYEMLTGEPPHAGTSAQQIIMRIVTEKPRPVSEARALVPPNVAAAVTTALQKLPADRFDSAKAFADALVNAGYHGTAVTSSISATAPGTSDARRWKARAIALGALAAVMAVGLAMLGIRLSRSGNRGFGLADEIRFTITLPTDSGIYLGGVEDAAFGRPSATSFTLSPDSRVLVYAGWRADSSGKVTSRLYRRALAQEQSDPIPGTDSGASPFFSPDGKWIGFFAGAALKRASVTGGNVEIVAQDAHVSGSMACGANWGDDGTIAYCADYRIYRVSAGGGAPKPIAMTRRDSATSRPVVDSAAQFMGSWLLPGGRTLLVSRWISKDPRLTTIVAVDLGTRMETTVLEDALDPRFVAPNRLLFARRGTLMAVGFDRSRLRTVGEPRVVLGDVMQAIDAPNAGWGTGAAQAAVSRSALAWTGGGTFPEPPTEVFRVAPTGRAQPLGWEPRQYEFLRVSPKGDRVAYSAGPGGRLDIYVHDLARGTTSRVNTGGPYSNEVGAWSPDGASLLISYAQGADPIRRLYRASADNSGPPQPVLSDQEVGGRSIQEAGSWSSQGVIAYVGDGDIWTVAPGATPVPFVATAADEWSPAFSPDGRWLAYVSDASGRGEVYVRPYPGPGTATLVSGNGGSRPTWSPDGHRIYYIQPSTPALAMMVADVLSEAPLRVGRPRSLIDPWPYVSTTPRTYDVMPDGSFIASQLQGAAAFHGSLAALVRRYRVGEIHVIVNFAAGLAPGSGK